MKISLLFLVICLAVGLASALKNTSGDRLNRPKLDVFGPRQRRALNGVKGGGIRVHPIFQFTTKSPNVRKGEYICGNKVCKLQPGVEPKGCNGMCQYPVGSGLL